MKVAMVVPGGVDRGGVERVIPIILAHVERIARVHQLHVFALHQEATPCSYPLLGATVHCVGSGRGATLRAARAMLLEHGRAPFQLLHALFGGSATSAALAGAVAGVPVIAHLAGGELTDLPVIGYGGWRFRWPRWKTRAVLRRAARVTSPSRPMVERARSLGIPAELLPLGIDLGHWTPMPPRRRDAGTARLLFVGTLNRVKDPVTAVRAAAALRDRGIEFHLEMVGMDILDGQVQRAAEALGLGARVSFTGFLPQGELRRKMADAHLLLVSSLHEAGPIVVFEAAACGVPTVGTPVGHVAEWAPDAAVTVPPADPLAMAEAVAGLLEDEDRRLTLATEAQRRLPGVDADHTARRVLDLYDQVAGR
jgi:glycosyltransferase involved in cell wall biosynthesis